jgi:hypothetical protein
MIPVAKLASTEATAFNNVDRVELALVFTFSSFVIKLFFNPEPLNSKILSMAPLIKLIYVVASSKVPILSAGIL